jgi:hypothetical protein
MTLVVLIPTQDGFLFAADSRTTVRTTAVNEVSCDNAFKIIELTHRKHTAITVTGHGTVLPRNVLALVAPCRYIKVTPPLLDIESLVQQELDSGSGILCQEEILALANKCRDSVAKFALDDARFMEQFRGKAIFRVVIGSYNPADRTFLVVTFEIATGKDLTVQVGDIELKQMSMDDRGGAMLFGEVPYVQQHVYNLASGLEHFNAFRQSGKKVKDITVAEAQAAAVNLIEATSRRTEEIPASSGIGGPVDVLLVNDKEIGTRLRWKPDS